MKELFAVDVMVFGINPQYRGQIYCDEVQESVLFGQTFIHFYNDDNIIASFSTDNATYLESERKLIIKNHKSRGL